MNVTEDAATSPPRPLLFRSRGERRSAVLAWSAAWLVSALVIALVTYTSRDPDSTVYAGIAARLAQEPIGRWIAPQWWGHWNFHGPFREHPVGIFVLPALLGRAGYPPEQAAYAVNGCYQIASIVLLQLIAATVVRPGEARAVGWMMQLMPIAFVFRVRANQEYAVLAGILLAVYATERSRRRVTWAWVTSAGFAWTLLVKGVFGFVTPLACALWLGTRHQAHARRRTLPWVALGVTVLVAPVLALAYESAYVRATGESFLAFYTGPRLKPEAVASGAAGRVAYNTLWYVGRLVWYAFPWSVVALAGALSVVARRGSLQGHDPATSTHRPAASGGPATDLVARAALIAAVAGSLVLVVLFAFSDRKADRFIFPAYYFLAAAGGVAALRASPRLAAVALRVDRAWVPATVWLGLFLARILTGSHLPQITFWRS